MGSGYTLKCSTCDYQLPVMEGIGMFYSRNSVFYGRCDDPMQNRSGAFHCGWREEGGPLLQDLVKCKEIKEKAFELLEGGAVPISFAHELYICPECHNLSSLFHFSLNGKKGYFEPEYKCTCCNASLKRAEVEFLKDSVEIYVDRRKINWKCPVCRGEALLCVDFFLWD